MSGKTTFPHDLRNPKQSYCCFCWINNVVGKDFFHLFLSVHAELLGAIIESMCPLRSFFTIQDLLSIACGLNAKMNRLYV